MWMARREFRIFLHPVSQIVAIAESRGLKRSVSKAGVFWEIAYFVTS
jgi:hypothetical protein